MDKLSEIKKVVADFIAAGDNNDTELLSKVLHPNYQNIQDGFFDQPGIRVIYKDEYIELVRTGRFGGSPRSIEFELFEELENIAIVKVKLESEYLRFLSYIAAVCEDGIWQVINNMPKIELKK
jgi:hypothetical protein